MLLLLLGLLLLMEVYPVAMENLYTFVVRMDAAICQKSESEYWIVALILMMCFKSLGTMNR